MMPDDELRDCRGTKVEVGQRVAYNLSGEVSLGEVVRVVKGETETNYPNPYVRVIKDPLIEVEPILDVHSRNRKKPSKVRNPRNLLVLFDNEK